MIITDALKCFITCGITPCQEKIDHIEIFNGDYSQTKVFEYYCTYKESIIV